MTYVNELIRLRIACNNDVKKLENIKHKLLNANWSPIFNEICLKESILPNYTTIFFYKIILYELNHSLHRFTS